MRTPVEDRFWKHVKKTKDCWHWTGYKTYKGYGRIDNHMANRLSWEMHHGNIPKSMIVIPDCGNKGCVNPSHLSLKTRSGYMEELGMAGKLYGTRLTKQQIRTIRQLYGKGKSGKYAVKKKNPYSQAALARSYGVCRQVINNIVRRKTYNYGRKERS